MKRFNIVIFFPILLLFSFSVQAQLKCSVIEFSELQTFNENELKSEYCKNIKSLAYNRKTKLEIMKRAAEMMGDQRYSRAQAHSMMNSTEPYDHAISVCSDQILRITRLLKSKDIDINPKQCDVQ